MLSECVLDSATSCVQEIFSQYGSVKQVTVLPVAAGKSAAAAFVIMHTVTRQRKDTTKNTIHGTGIFTYIYHKNQSAM